MAPVMEANLRALAERAPEHPARSRYRRIAEIVTGRQGAEADDGLAISEIPALVAKAKAASSMSGNPVQLSDEELGDIVRGAL
jgi:hypothetical protein